MSVSSLLKEGKIAVVFSYLHDKETEQAIVVGWMNGGLYKLDESSFGPPIIHSCFFVVNTCNKMSDIWHMRLKHVSTDVLLHIPQIELKYYLLYMLFKFII